MALPSRVKLWLLWSLWVLHSCATFVNITWDDTFPDPISGNTINYQPSDAWHGSRNCRDCTARPDENQAYKKSWHDSTFSQKAGKYPNQVLFATASFTGSAIYVKCILARTTSNPVGNSDLTFILDGEVVGTFAKPAPGVPGFDYNIMVYANDSLQDGPHQLIIQNGHVDGADSLLLLDSITYTYNDGQKAFAQQSPPARAAGGLAIGIVVGCVLGSLAVIILAFLAFFACRREQRMDRVPIHPYTKYSAWSEGPHDGYQPLPALSAYPFIHSTHVTSSRTSDTIVPNNPPRSFPFFSNLPTINPFPLTPFPSRATSLNSSYGEGTRAEKVAMLQAVDGSAGATHPRPTTRPRGHSHSPSGVSLSTYTSWNASPSNSSPSHNSPSSGLLSNSSPRMTHLRPLEAPPAYHDRLEEIEWGVSGIISRNLPTPRSEYRR